MQSQSSSQPQQIIIQQAPAGAPIQQSPPPTTDPNMVQFITQQQPGQPPRVVQVLQAPGASVGTPTQPGAPAPPLQFVPVQHIQAQQQQVVSAQSSTPTGGVGEDPRNLIVNYVPTPVTDHELRQLFEQYGELESARVICDRVTGHPKGYGFVKYKDPAGAKAAMENMNGFELYNKRLKVTTAKGPQNAAINQHTNRLQQTIVQASGSGNMVVMQTPPPLQVQAPGGVQQGQPQQQVAPYVVLKDSQQPTFGGVTVPAGGTSGISTITFQQPQQQQQVSGQPQQPQQQQQQPAGGASNQTTLQMFVPLNNTNDPMQRDSCYFSVGQSQQVSQISSQQGLSSQFSSTAGHQ